MSTRLDLELRRDEESGYKPDLTDAELEYLQELHGGADEAHMWGRASRTVKAEAA